MIAAQKILAWLGHGLIKLPSSIAPPGVRVVRRWQVHHLTRTHRSEPEQFASDFPRNEREEWALGGANDVGNRR